MSHLEPQTVDHLPERCEECGARLTADEQRAVLEGGGPPLCAIHAAEDEPGLVADESEPDGG
jgi:hypothetical protein